MAYIVTYSLNREEESYYIIESLDDLAKMIANHIIYDEDNDQYYNEDIEDYDVHQFDLIDIFEISDSVKTEALMEKAYADAQTLLIKSMTESREREAERIKQSQLRELERLKAIYEK